MSAYWGVGFGGIGVETDDADPHRGGDTLRCTILNLAPSNASSSLQQHCLEPCRILRTKIVLALEDCWRVDKSYNHSLVSFSVEPQAAFGQRSPVSSAYALESQSATRLHCSLIRNKVYALIHFLRSLDLYKKTCKLFFVSQSDSQSSGTVRTGVLLVETNLYLRLNVSY